VTKNLKRDEENNMAPETRVTNLTSLTPLNGHVLVCVSDRETTTETGIIIPDTVQEDMHEGRVVAVGAGRLLDSGRRAAPQVGLYDHVVWRAGQGLPLIDDHAIVKEYRELLALDERQLVACRGKPSGSEYSNDDRSKGKTYGMARSSCGEVYAEEEEPEQKRELTDVLCNILKMIPEDEQELRGRLDDILDSARYCPPEGVGIHWKAAHEALFETLGDEPAPGWKLDAALLWKG
jgi:chaperonin GroES